ncbi:alginate O-acetyltransferase complex protein AlgI [Sarcina sp. DSM 11001]|nr:alginate O-acetyltransferase complex protein AlgI [Sarcina sp. DSM 11001]
MYFEACALPAVLKTGTVRMINFSGVDFIFRFLPVFLILYSLIPPKYRDILLFAGSIFFYASGARLFVFVLLGLVVINYLFGELVYVQPGRPRRASHKKMMFAVILIDVGILILFKMLALRVSASLLPLGLSFYIFKMLSYQADLFRGEINKRPSFFQAAAYFTMFPQISQGPIMRFSQGWTEKPSNIRRQFAFVQRTVPLHKIEDGITFFIMGLAMKVLIADRLGMLWNEIIKIGFESISTPLAWIGAAGYSLELYFDFWGYSLMAGGLGLMLGFRYIHNFIHPYAACGIADFYRRWHATLGSWFRDYVYIPLGGSRDGAASTIRNLVIVWLLTGFWHGGTLNFILWGAVLCLLIILEKFVAGGLIRKIPVIGHLLVIFFIPLTWVIFAITDLKDLGIYFTRLFPFFGPGTAVNSSDYLKYLGIYWPFLAVGILLCIPVFYNLLVWKRRNPVVIALLFIVFWISVYFSSISAGNPFMYFSF